MSVPVLTMSKHEFERAVLLRKVHEKRLTQRKAAELLKLRWFGTGTTSPPWLGDGCSPLAPTDWQSHKSSRRRVADPLHCPPEGDSANSARKPARHHERPRTRACSDGRIRSTMARSDNVGPRSAPARAGTNECRLARLAWMTRDRSALSGGV